LYCPTPLTKPTLLQILLHDHSAMYGPPPTPPVYTIHHTILVTAISFKAQLAVIIHIDREDASFMVTAGATENTTEGNSRASRESGSLCSHSRTAKILGAATTPSNIKRRCAVARSVFVSGLFCCRAFVCSAVVCVCM